MVSFLPEVGVTIAHAYQRQRKRTRWADKAEGARTGYLLSLLYDPVLLPPFAPPSNVMPLRLKNALFWSDVLAQVLQDRGVGAD